MNTVDSTPETYSLEQGWKTLALAGGAIAILGLIAMLLPFATGIALSYLLGVVLVVSAVVHGYHAFGARGWTGRAWQLTLGVVSAVAGIAVIVNPIIGLMTLTLLAIAYLIVDGIAELATGFHMEPDSGRGWVGASGVISLVLAGLLWGGFPVDALWFVGVAVGLSLLLTGFSMVAVAYTGRRVDEDVTPPTVEPRGA